MSLQPQPIKAVPPETVRVARAAFPKGSPYLTLRDELGVIFDDSDFAELFATVGQPALSPWQIALVTVLQFRENLSDRQAAEAVRSRIDWKYLLGLELTDEGFHFSVLSDFRERLITGKQEHLLLDKLLRCCREKGIIKARGKQRTDATRVLASVRKLNRLELVGETMRAALNELATVAPEWLSEVAPDEWYERYGRRIEDFRLPKAADKRDAYGQQVGEDADYLLKCLANSDIANWQELAKIHALQLVIARHYKYKTDAEEGSAAIHWKAKKELPRSESGIESPYDIDARYRSRYGVSWLGYVVHMSETCDDEQCHLITHVETTDATVHEVNRTQAIHQSLIDKNLSPSEHFVDSAYVDAEHLVKAEKQQITIVGPTRKNSKWQTKIENGYDQSRFEIHWSEKYVICPEGKRSISWRPYTQAGKKYNQVSFSKNDCFPCAARERCTRATQRRMGLLQQAEYEALERTRQVHRSKEGRERYKRRAGIEGTLSQGVRSFGMRRSRYRGQAKTHLQNVATGAAMNIDRLVSWFDGRPLAKTRVSRFKALQKVG